jgi:hypothetical protein
MSAMFILWIVWAVVVVILLVLLGYRATLTRYEEDQLFLAAAADHEARQQSAILLKVAKIQPYVRLAIGATCALSLCIIGLFIWNAIRLLS